MFIHYNKVSTFKELLPIKNGNIFKEENLSLEASKI